MEWRDDGDDDDGDGDYDDICDDITLCKASKTLYSNAICSEARYNVN